MGWFKSSFSNGNATCVEVLFHGDLVSVRDSKAATPTVLRFPPAEWSAFIAGVRAQEFGDPAARLT
jgi:hypothetical protein